jgi:lantibiotic protection ABC transporter MutG family permease subunit
MIMAAVTRCIKAEFAKCRHSALLYIHILVPLLGAVVFAGYFRISGWDVQTNISAYLEVLAIAFPFLIGIIVGMVVGLENQAGHWQLMLGTIPSRSAAYIGKLSFLMISAAAAAALALGCFAAIYREAPLPVYLKAWILLVLAVFPLYLIHLFVGMRAALWQL